MDQSLGTLSLGFVEGLYADYLRDPEAVPAEWRSYFDDLPPSPDLADGAVGMRDGLGPHFPPSSVFNPPTSSWTAAITAVAAPPSEARTAEAPAGPSRTPPRSLDVALSQDRVDQLIRAYRVRGHKVAQIDPLGLPRPPQPELEPAFYGFTEEDFDRPFSTSTIHGAETRTLRKILERLRNTYCRRIGVQFMHIDDLSIRQWLQDRMEGTENRLQLDRKEQLRIFTRLTDAVILEEFIQKRFVGAKSFSLEGAESLIPLLDLAVEKAGEDGIREIVMGMAHRGRLNVLVNIIGKSPRQVFREFDDVDPEINLGRGDVKYHLGYSSDWTTATGKQVHLSLCFNPSHLEFVNTVALGRLRAKQDRAHDIDRTRGMVLLIHGDAAFAGEGIVQETLNLSQLEGYRTGGTLHVVVNNQLGFTTPPADGRSCMYATDVAKMLQIPIFHVNGEDPEAVAQVVRLAMDFRSQFCRDVVIDMYSFRRRGHNEGDEPSFTQPLMYRAIERRQSVRDGYLEHLLGLDGVTREEADKIATRRRERLEQELSVARSDDYVATTDAFQGIWRGYCGGPEKDAPNVPTAVDRATLVALLNAQTQLPEDFRIHAKLKRFLQNRQEMAAGARPLDWSAAEALALASIAADGFRVRLSGQDSARGTFSQRHAVLHDVTSGETYMPLGNLGRPQAPVEIYNSPLSETGVLGYEYGYSLDCPDGLIMWEAQFGDFVNAAQVIIDQFIASAEDKWRRLSGVTLLLPHGFEGMGPEHSSARLERFLTLAADDNIQVVNPTTPAQYFHCLRRQVVRPWRKPLVVMTPKSLLRHADAVSSLDDLSQGDFQRVLRDDAPRSNDAVRRVLLCCGKIYYDLAAERAERKCDDVALVRLEQLYPLADADLSAALEAYPTGTPVWWVQEEPENMGAWRYLRVRFGDTLYGRHPFSGVSRPASASPATGSAAAHKWEQRELLARAFSEL